MKRTSTPIPDEAKYYQVFCAVALAMIFAVKAMDGITGATLLALVGVWGVLSKLRLAPILLLGMIALLELGRNYAWGNMGGPIFRPRSPLQVPDILLSVSVLGYVVGHYRLQSLVLNVLPLDPRQRTGPPRWYVWPPTWHSGIQPTLRSGNLVTAREIGVLVIVLPLAAMIAQAVWAALAPPRPVFDFSPAVSRMLLLAWSLVPAVLCAAVIMSLWRRRHMGPEAAALYLQDVLWAETRREQRRLWRWAAWRRLRGREMP